MKISVIIITRNRCKDLRNTLKAYLNQTYGDKEVIVVDNASNDGTREMMRLEFQEIKYLWLPENFDIRSINIGIEMSSGDIIWRTDDDSYPEQADAFEKVIEIFRKNEDIHIICSEDIEVRQNYKIWEWYPNKVDKINIPEKGYIANSFPGTGAGIRREVFNKVGGFWEFGFEELDFCTRAIVAGYNIRYFPNIRTLHFASPENRNNSVRWVKISKQLIRYQWKYFPFWMALRQSILYITVQFIEALLKKLPVSAIFEGLFGMFSVAFGAYREERQVVPADKIEEVTLGTNAFKTQIHYYKTIIGRKFNFKNNV